MLNVGIVAALVAAAVVGYLIASADTPPDDGWGSLLSSPFIFGAFAAVAYGGRVRRRLASDYKRIVVGRIVTALGQGLKYSPTSRLTKQDFQQMDLFEKRVEKWQAEDEVAGVKNGVTYTLHEATATRTEGSGKKRREVTIFRGLIVRLDFNKHFGGHTIVVPHGETKVLGLFGESENRRQKELVSLENVDFEAQYSVYSTDQQEARYLLTPKMMELIMEARALFTSPMSGAQAFLMSALSPPHPRLCFRDSSVYVTVWSHQNRFEISLLGPKVKPETVAGEFAELIKLAERLIETLQLETRIWSRA
jgi:hypothetical protein